MRIDSHVHFWRYQPQEYSWIGPDMGVLKCDRLPPEARELLGQQRIDGCVAVQARTSEAETDFLLELAAENPWISAVVGWVDLSDERLSRRLERWGDAKRLAGFRHVLQNDPAAGDLVEGAGFRRGVSLLQERSMVYELLVSADQLPLMTGFCRALDRHWLVLDHLGKPDIRNRQFDSWLRDVTLLAQLPHVVCKLSGIVTEANDAGGAFDETCIRRYLDAALDLFGARRLMFGTDWPVCTLVASYAATTQIVDRWSSRLSASDREWLWGGTAAKVYRLDKVRD
jgi:L-fuconolactonase